MAILQQPQYFNSLKDAIVALFLIGEAWGVTGLAYMPSQAGPPPPSGHTQLMFWLQSCNRQTRGNNVHLISAFVCGCRTTTFLSNKITFFVLLLFDPKTYENTIKLFIHVFCPVLGLSEITCQADFVCNNFNEIKKGNQNLIGVPEIEKNDLRKKWLTTNSEVWRGL